MEIPSGSIVNALQQARTLYDDGQYAECERLCRDILRRDSDQPEALSILGYLAQRGAAPNVAIECFQRLCDLQPDVPAHRGALASALRQAGHHQEALQAQASYVELAPDDTAALQNLALQYSEVGDFERARASYEKVLASMPSFGRAHYGLALIKKFEPGDPQISQMSAVLESGDIEPAERSRIAMSLGKAHEDLGDYDQAFAYYELGNRIKRDLISFDIDEERSKTARLIQSFSTELLDKTGYAGCPSEVPVFIVGMPRSGSTLVEQIIASHPEVHGAGELPNLFQTIERGLHGRISPDRQFPEAVKDIPRVAWSELGAAYLASIQKLAPDALRIVDKQLFNYPMLGIIHLMLPKARIIHCTRDPLDTCVSCFTQSFGAERGFTCDLSELGATYRLYQSVMAHWRKWLPDPMLEVAYEDLVADPETQARRLIRFLGLEWNDACLAFHHSDRAVVTSSLGQVREPIYSSSIGRWRRFESHLSRLQEALATDV